MSNVKLKAENAGEGALGDSRVPMGAVVFWLLRTAIGWHFLYEGVWKLMQKDGWSCASYLGAAQGPLASVFKWMSTQGWIVSTGDWAVQLGLVAIGLSLVTGVLARAASLFGIALLAMFYCCQPPEPFCTAMSGADGRFFLFDRNVIEAFGLLLVAATPTRSTGEASVVPVWLRRLIPGAVVLVVFGCCVWHQVRVGGFKKVEAVTSATVKVHEFTALAALKTPFAEKASVAGVEISRLALGGDLIDGHAHARDLIWTDEFMRRYHAGGTLERTIRYCSFCGIDAVCCEPTHVATMRSAAQAVGSDLKAFVSCTNAQDAAQAKTAGAKAVYLRPETTDALAAANDVAALRAVFTALKSSGLPVGIGAEDVASVKFCVANDLVPDFWVLAFHSLDYPAAKLKTRCNNIWCRDPEGTAAYMKTRKEPWIAVRVLAGGAIDPVRAWTFAVQHGATAVAIDLPDYRIVETVNGIVKTMPRGGQNQGAAPLRGAEKGKEDGK